MVTRGTDYFDYDLYKAWCHGNIMERIFHSRRLNEVNDILDLGGKTILDYGTGTGIFMINYRKLGYDIEGFDISKRNIERARLYLLENGLSDDGLYLRTLPDKKYDIILLLNVIEYAVDKVNIISNIYKHLKPAGELLVSVAYVKHPFVKFAWLRALLSGRSSRDIAISEPKLHICSKEVIDIFSSNGFYLRKKCFGFLFVNQYFLFSTCHKHSNSRNRFPEDTNG